PPCYPLSLHDALPISMRVTLRQRVRVRAVTATPADEGPTAALSPPRASAPVSPALGNARSDCASAPCRCGRRGTQRDGALAQSEDRKSTRLNSSHDQI